MLTLEQAKELYAAGHGTGVTPNQLGHSTQEWADIQQEMQRVIDSPSDHEAGFVIAWWGNWNDDYTPTAFAHRIREAYAKMNKPTCDPNLVFES